MAAAFLCRLYIERYVISTQTTFSTERSRNKHVGGEKSTNKCDVEKCVCVFQVGIVSYGENVTHNVNLSQFDNTPALLEFVDELPQETGLRTMTFQGIDTAR